jgi:hypothetical protein
MIDEGVESVLGLLGPAPALAAWSIGFGGLGVMLTGSTRPTVVRLADDEKKDWSNYLSMVCTLYSVRMEREYTVC